jgi:DNA-binding NtrC family response regulator
MNKLILIVDDDPDIVSAMQTGLDAQGYDVKIAHHVASAMEIISTAAPVIVFLDYYIAGDNPAEFVRKAKSLYPGMPIILMTAANSACDKAKNVGLAYYLQKPFELENLLEVVRRCIARLAEHPALQSSPSNFF